MHRLALLSDLHLEFCRQGYPHDLPEADILLLSGDILVAAYLSATRTDKDAKNHQWVVKQFFTKAVQKYRYIVWVFGNHEHYRSNYFDTRRTIENFLLTLDIDQDKIFILENEKLVVNDLVILGATLWTDFNGENPVTMNEVRYAMNDYRVITHGLDGKSVTLNPYHTLEIHKKTVGWLDGSIAIEGALGSIAPSKVVIMTHMAPSKKSTHVKYKDDFHMNGAYSTDLEKLMIPPVKLWVHGHTHETFDYDVNGTRVRSNPMGYWQTHDYNPKFDPALILEV